MYLRQLRAFNFKNYEKASIVFDPKVNIVFGPNGSGKTNILDAIHFLSVSKSYFGLSDKYLIKDAQDFYRLEAEYQKEERKQNLIIKYKRDQGRSIQINEKKLKRVNDLIGRYPVVLIAPDDIKIVKGGSKERRDYFNKWLCQSNATYLDALIKYNRLLRQKDALLKADRRPHHLAVESFNHQMIPLSITLNQIINQSLSEYIPKAQAQYDSISDGADLISIKYHSDLNDVDVSSLFSDVIDQEIAVRRPLVGVQRDDYEFEIEGRPFKKFGSQGQIKSLLYCLRLAEFAFLKDHLDVMPILILDDFFEKLDNQRLSALLSLINSEAFGQVFLSDTELERSQKIFEERGINFGAYRVENGNISRVQ